jgi:hypothetical protein
MFHTAFYWPCYDTNAQRIHWLSLLILMWFLFIGGGIEYMQVVLRTFQRCYPHIKGELQNIFTHKHDPQHQCTVVKPENVPVLIFSWHVQFSRFCSILPNYYNRILIPIPISLCILHANTSSTPRTDRHIHEHYTSLNIMLVSLFHLLSSKNWPLHYFLGRQLFLLAVSIQ